ncbi:MAG TPA: hypothetical protein VFZ59_03395, partial [Verrucomicrobiae bacterium]|nr:hypothetical protein [Verrucomicrobiae bacterium]
MPVWQVWEAQADYRLFDNPLKYIPAFGPAVSLDLVYQTWRPTDYGYYPRHDLNPLFGAQWHSIWSSELVIVNDSNAHWNQLGGRIIFSFSTPLLSDPHSHSGARIEILVDGQQLITGGKIHKSDGSVLEYSQAATFVYGDLDGDLDQSNNRIATQVNTPGGYTASFGYEQQADGRWYLTNIVDAANIPTSFTYREDEMIINFDSHPYWSLATMTTPYGTTQFDYLGDLVPLYNGWAEVKMTHFGTTLLITEPNGGKHLYLQADHAVSNVPIPSTFNASVIPSGLPVGTLDTNRVAGNTYYWGPLQLAGIGNVDIDSWDWDEFKRARIRHWLWHHDDWDGGHLHISDVLSWEQKPSPDGSTEGQVTWYDYAGKNPSNPEKVATGTGTQMPSVISRVLPGGNTWYQYFEYNAIGHQTKMVETYTQPGGNIGTRTNTFTYAGNGIDLVLHIGPQGEQVVSNRFNGFHQVTNSFNALNELTEYTFNANRQLTSIRTPGGLTTTNIYFSSGASEDRLDKTIDLEINRTNSYTYSGDMVDSHTDERGLTVTNYWDGLARLTGRKYPDGTTTSNIYTALNVTATKDRMGFWSYASYNGIRQKVAETNANGVVTRYGLCDCGAVMSVTNAWSTPAQLVTSFNYDLQGNRTHIFYPDATVTNWYDSLQRVIVSGDAWGYRWFGYNNQGLLTSITNAYGAERFTVFDIDDHPIYVTDANGVTVTNTYDDLGRLRTRTYPDTGVEHFGYSARGLVAYTNQLGATNFFAYDEAGRKRFETNANWELIRFTNSPAGDLLALVDGKNQVTKWNYDEYGRVTNKLDQLGAEVLRYTYDANSRLASRWSAAKGTTYYTNDAVGNVTKVNYPASVDITLQYDPLNRVTNMVDAAGTTAYTYASGGQLYTEDGPFADDTVTNTFNNRLRVGMDLKQPTGVWTNAFGYDTAKRLTSVTSPAGAFGYVLADLEPSRLPIRLDLPNSNYITNVYDLNARLWSTMLKKSDHSTLNSHTYAYNAANQRTQQAFGPVGSTYNYSYDSIGQLKVADSASASEDRGYAYDSAWNLSFRTNNGAL